MHNFKSLSCWKLRLFFFLPILFACWADGVAQSSVVEVPLTFRRGKAPFQLENGVEFRTYPHWQATGNAALGRILPKVKGVPKSWSDVTTNFVWFDIQQFVYQNFKQGKVTEADYDALVKSLHIDLKKRQLSTRVVNCFAAYVTGKDEKGTLLYKIDLNHNLNFADDPIQIPEGNTAYLQKLHPNDGKDTVKYETIRHGKIVDREALLQVFPFDSVVHININEYAVCKLSETYLYFTSHGFASADYEYSEMHMLTRVADNTYVDEVYEEAFFAIGDTRYQYLGVDLNREVARFRKVKPDTVIYGLHDGLQAPLFEAIDLDGDTVDITSYRGKYLYIDFWLADDTWGNKRSMQMYNAYQKTNRSMIEFIQFVQLDNGKDAGFYRNYVSGWKKMVCNERTDILKDYNVPYGTRNILIDPNGKIVLKNIDATDLYETIFSLPR